jgi:HlyD family secretion protein
MTANLSIPLISVGSVLAIPLASVFNDQGERFVYVKTKDNKFERQSVQLGVADFDFAEVTKGLKGGEVISLIAPPIEANAGQTAGAKSGATATAK